METIVDRIWEKFLTDRDRAVFAASGYGSNAGFGKKPALLVIDVSYGFTGEQPEPILDSIKAMEKFMWRRELDGDSRHQRPCRFVPRQEIAGDLFDRLRPRR
jgi:hypothetical protein